MKLRYERGALADLDEIFACYSYKIICTRLHV